MSALMRGMMEGHTFQPGSPTSPSTTLHNPDLLPGSSGHLAPSEIFLFLLLVGGPDMVDFLLDYNFGQQMTHPLQCPLVPQLIVGGTYSVSTSGRN